MLELALCVWCPSSINKNFVEWMGFSRYIWANNICTAINIHHCQTATTPKSLSKSSIGHIYCKFAVYLKFGSHSQNLDLLTNHSLTNAFLIHLMGLKWPKGHYFNFHWFVIYIRFIALEAPSNGLLHESQWAFCMSFSHSAQ